MSDEDAAMLLDAYPHWSPMFGEASAQATGLIRLTGFQVGPDRTLCTEEVETFLKARRADAKPQAV